MLSEECIFCIQNTGEKIIVYDHCGKFNIHPSCYDKWNNLYFNQCFICRKKIADVEDNKQISIYCYNYNFIRSNNYNNSTISTLFTIFIFCFLMFYFVYF